MSPSKPVFYNVSDTPVDSLTKDQLITESDDLKREKTTIEARIAEKKVWAEIEGETNQYLEWLAKSRNFLGRLTVRYSTVRAALKKLNRNK